MKSASGGAWPVHQERKTSPSIHAVIFDKDGVLVDFQRTWTPLIKRVALEVAEGDESTARSLLVKVGYRPEHDDFAPGSIWAVGTNEELLAAWFGEASAKRKEAFLALMAHLCETTDPAPACPPLQMRRGMERLKAHGIRLAIATNDTTASARRMTRLFSIADVIDHVVGFDAVNRPKPAADPVFAIADRLAVSPQHIAVIGDSPHDAEMARAAGCAMFIGVRDGTSDVKTLRRISDHVVADVLEAMALVSQACHHLNQRGTMKR